MADELARDFILPPFTTLSTRSPYWRGRRDNWTSLGIQSECGRKENLAVGKFKFNLKTDAKGDEELVMPSNGWLIEDGGTSIFDPVLCELMYRWFSPVGGRVLDPFAGGSVRGIVAGVLGRDYTGIELREEQVLSNRQQALRIKPECDPRWFVGDSVKMPDMVPEGELFDFIFSCPPYVDLEVYSDDPQDLSNMDWAEFRGPYRQIIKHAVDRLKPNRFACFVVGDARDKKTGNFYNLPGETISAFIDAGANLYNEAIFITPVASLALRVSKQMKTSRKMGKAHQNILVFVKGDGRTATEELGPVDVSDHRGLFNGIPQDSVLEMFGS